MAEPRRPGQRVFVPYALGWMVAVVAITTAVLLPWYRQSVALVGAEFDAAITQELRGLLARYNDSGLDGLIGELDWRSRDASDREAVYVLVDDELNRLAGNLDSWPEALSHPRPGRFAIDSGRYGPLDGAVLHIGERHWLLAGRHSPLSTFRARLLRYALAAGTGLLLSTALCAWLFGRHLSRRLQRMADDADAIRTGNLRRRLLVSRRNDDLDVLASRFNATFADLQRSLDGVRHVSSAIAHDLRRPLIRLRQQLETAARANPQDIDSDSPITDALQAVDASLSVFAAILRLARIESGALGHTHRSQRLDVIVADAAELIRPLFEQCARELHVRVTAASVVGDRDLLFQLTHNLLENALQHGAGAVAVRVIAGDPAQLLVCDQGEGVAPEDIAHLGERFWRADTARSSEGSGLGLSLCRAIVEAHDGRITFIREEGGFSVCVSLPGVTGAG